MKNRISRIDVRNLFLLACFLFFRTGGAQDLSEMRFDLLNEEDGLSSHVVNSIAQDSSGNLWIATDGGLDRYDGYSFLHFHHDSRDSSSLLSNTVRSLLVDHEGNLWVGYGTGGLSLFHPRAGNFSHVTPAAMQKGAIDKPEVALLFCDRNNTIWFAGWESGLSSYDPVSHHFRNYSLTDIAACYSGIAGVQRNTVTSITSAPGNSLWVTSQNGLYLFDISTGSFSYRKMYEGCPPEHRDDVFTNCLADGDKGLWLSSFEGGLAYYDITAGKFTNYKFKEVNSSEKLSNVIYDVAVKSKDELWITTSDYGLGIFNTESHTFIFNTQSDADNSSYPSCISYSILEGKYGNLWITCDKGVMQYNNAQRPFHFRKLNVAQSSNGAYFQISNIIRDSLYKKTYFAVDFGNGLNVLDNSTGELEAFPTGHYNSSPDSYMFVNDICLASDHTLWTVSTDFIYCFDPAKNKLYKPVQPFDERSDPESPFYSDIFIDHGGTLWVASVNKGLLCYDKIHDTWNLYKADKMIYGMKIDGFAGIAEDHCNRLWLCTSGGNLLFFDEKTKTFSESSSLPAAINALPAGSITDVVSDTEGNIWVSTNANGIYRICFPSASQMETKNYSAANELSFGNVRYIFADSLDHIWASSSTGVSVLDASSGKSRIFTTADGMYYRMAELRFNQVDDHTLAIGGEGQYCFFDLHTLDIESPLPVVKLDHIKALDEEIVFTPDSLITLGPSQNYVSFEFGAIDFNTQQKDAFAYKLEGFDKDWVYCNERRFASYTNLDGGDYVFMVKAGNGTSWGKPISVSVHIGTFFYRQSWFVILCVCVLIILLFALYKFRVARIYKAESVKTEMTKKVLEAEAKALQAQMNPHFIFNSFNAILEFIRTSDTKNAMLYMTKFSRLIRMVLETSNHRTISLQDEIEIIRMYIELENIRMSSNFNYEIKIDPALDLYDLEIPAMIIQPFIENAILHGIQNKQRVSSDNGSAYTGHLRVEFNKADDVLKVVISDDGIGRRKAMEIKMKKSLSHHSMGMRITEERLDILSLNQCSINITDMNDTDGGTRVEIMIPLIDPF